MPPSLYYTTTVVLPFTIVERGNQNRQGSGISTTKLVPRRINLVAILVPGGGSLGGGTMLLSQWSTRYNTLPHQRTQDTTSLSCPLAHLGCVEGSKVPPVGPPRCGRLLEGLVSQLCLQLSLRSVVVVGGVRTLLVHVTTATVVCQHGPQEEDTEAHSDYTDWFMPCLQNVW